MLVHIKTTHLKCNVWNEGLLRACRLPAVMYSSTLVARTQGDAKKYKAFSAWAKEVAAKPRPKDPLKPRKRKKAEANAEQDLALQIRCPM